MNQRRRRHHYAPVAYLSRFTDDGRLWQYDVETGDGTRLSPRDAAVETKLYAPEAGADPSDDSLEVALAELVDGPGNACIEKLIGGDPLDASERSSFALYLATMERRIPAQRDNVRDFVARGARLQLQMAAAHPEYLRQVLRSSGKTYTDAEFEDIRSSMARGELLVEPTKIHWLRSIAAAEDTAPTIAAMPWLVAEAPPGHEFITSDRPVLKVLTDVSVPRLYAGGWLSPSAESTFALSPSHCLVIRPDGREGRVTAKSAWARDVNSRTIRLAHRFVYSRRAIAYLTKVLAKRRRPRL